MVLMVFSKWRLFIILLSLVRAGLEQLDTNGDFSEIAENDRLHNYLNSQFSQAE